MQNKFSGDPVEAVARTAMHRENWPSHIRRDEVIEQIIATIAQGIPLLTRSPAWANPGEKHPQLLSLTFEASVHARFDAADIFTQVMENQQTGERTFRFIPVSFTNILLPMKSTRPA